MRKEKIILTIFFIVAIYHFTYATTYTWTAGFSNNASNPLNWSPGFLSVPGSNDDVVFDGSAPLNCTWNIPAVNSFSVLSGYTGNINIVGNVVINANLVINSGSVLSTSGDLTLAGSGSGLFNLGGTGIFNPGIGNVNLQVDPGQTFNFIGSITLNTLTIVGSNLSNNPRSINFGSNLSVDVLVMAVGFKEHSYQGSVHIKQKLDVGGNAFKAEYTNIPPNNTATFIFDGTHALIEGVSNSFKGPLSNITMSTSGTYTINDNLNIYGDWSGSQGTLSVGNSKVNLFGTLASITGTAAAFDDLEIKNGAIISMPSNAEVKVSGFLNRNGTLIFQTTTSLGLNGTGLQIINGSGFTLAGLTAYGTGSGRNVNINAPINILDSLKVGDDVTLTSGIPNNITLKSSNTLTARLAEMGTNASVTGNVTVETLIPGGSTGWSNLGVRGVQNQLINTWDTYVSSGGITGIPMTCNNCFYSPNSMPNGPFESIQGWDEFLQSYVTNLDATADFLDPGKGFWVYVGDGFSSTNDLTLINTGNLVSGLINLNITNTGGPDGGSNLIANPYPCPISWSKFVLTNGSELISNAYYVYNANPGGGTTSFINGVSTPAGLFDAIQGGQGFYIEADANTSGNIVFLESFKTTSNTSTTPLLKTNSSNIGQVFRLKVEGFNQDRDETAFRIHPNASFNFDKEWDARKMFQTPGYSGFPGPYTKYTTISSRLFNKDYSINSFASPTGTVSIPILVRVMASGTYTISAYDFAEYNACLVLKDNLNNAYKDLKTGPYICYINDTTSAPRFELIVCENGNTNSTSVKELGNSKNIFVFDDGNGVMVQTHFEQATNTTISAYNILGQPIMNNIQLQCSETKTHLDLEADNQIIFIKVSTGKETVTRKIVLH